MLTAATQTKHTIRLHRMIGAASKPRKRLPRQTFPKPIQREYARELLEIVTIIREMLKPLMQELPQMLQRAALERVDGERLDAGEGKKVQIMIDQVKEKLKLSISPVKVEDMATKFAAQASSFQKAQLAKQLKAGLGINPFIADKKVGTLVEGFVSENVSLIKGMSDEALSGIEKSVTRAVQRGTTYEALADELEQRFGIAEGRAKLIARDQIGTLTSQLNTTRQKELGIRRFKWKTSNDARVREEHTYRQVESEKTPYSYDDPPDDELPGEPINCRCYAEPVLADLLGDDDEDS